MEVCGPQNGGFVERISLTEEKSKSETIDIFSLPDKYTRRLIQNLSIFLKDFMISSGAKLKLEILKFNKTEI